MWEFPLGLLIGAALAMACVVILAVIGIAGWMNSGSH